MGAYASFASTVECAYGTDRVMFVFIHKYRAVAASCWHTIVGTGFNNPVVFPSVATSCGSNLQRRRRIMFEAKALQKFDLDFILWLEIMLNRYTVHNVIAYPVTFHHKHYNQAMVLALNACTKVKA